MSTTDQILNVLSTVAETDEVKQNLEIPLYDYHLLDSLKTVELIVALSEQLGVEISPAEIEREEWATPRKIVQYVENKLAA